jgi:hypothetical protein
MLTLDQTTLFYFSLSDTANAEDKQTCLIRDWATQIPHIAKPSSSSQSIVSTPSLTTDSSRASRPPVSTLTNNVRITSSQDADDIEFFTRGLSDRDETGGHGREVAAKSPPNGQRRVTNSVSITQQLSTSTPLELAVYAV